MRRLCETAAPMRTEFPDSHRDLLETKFATLATIGKDGGPQLTEVWFLFEDGKVKTSLNDSRLKTRNLVARPQCSLFILDLANPFRYLDVRGTAKVEPDDDYAFAARLGAKYGADVRDHDGPGEKRVVVTIEPTNVFAVDMGA
jgi:PPOX class probable F420-dependent enzyme